MGQNSCGPTYEDLERDATRGDSLEVDEREGFTRTVAEKNRDRIEYRWYCDMRDDGSSAEKMVLHFPTFVCYEARYQAEQVERRYRAEVGI